jgi:hypothetical protein
MGISDKEFVVKDKADYSKLCRDWQKFNAILRNKVFCLLAIRLNRIRACALKCGK